MGMNIGFDRLKSAESTTRLIDYYHLSSFDKNENTKIAGFIGSAKEDLALVA